MKKISLSLIILSALLTITPSVRALTPSSSSAIRKENREEMKEEIKERKEALLEKVKNFVKKNIRFEARVKGTITVIGTNNFSMTGEDGTFQVNITDNTKLLRKFGGKSSLSEFAVGDEVVVFGKFTDDTKSIIDAKIVRNNSIQKRWGAFFGKVTAINSDNFLMETLERGTQTVYFGTAKFVNRKEQSIAYSDVKIGHRVRVKGIWDKTLSEIKEVSQVKDFSIPVVKPTPTGL